MSCAPPRQLRTCCTCVHSSCLVKLTPVRCRFVRGGWCLKGINSASLRYWIKHALSRNHWTRERARQMNAGHLTGRRSRPQKESA